MYVWHINTCNKKNTPPKYFSSHDHRKIEDECTYYKIMQVKGRNFKHKDKEKLCKKLACIEGSLE